MSSTIGLISDTHGRLRSDVAAAFKDVDLILHAGDVGSLDVLVELRTLAPVQAVYGNVDDPWTPDLDETRWITLEGWTLVVTHGHQLRRLTPDALLHQFDADIIVHGHTHRPLVHRAGRRLVLNPGAAGPRRFDVVPSVARLVLGPGSAEVEHVTLG